MEERVRGERGCGVEEGIREREGRCGREGHWDGGVVAKGEGLHGQSFRQRDRKREIGPGLVGIVSKFMDSIKIIKITL